MHRQCTILQSTDNTQSTLPEAELCISPVSIHDGNERCHSFLMIGEHSHDDEAGRSFTPEVCPFSDDEVSRSCTPEVNSFSDDEVGSDISSNENRVLFSNTQEVNAHLNIQVEPCKYSPQKQRVDPTFSKLSSEEE